MLAGGTASRALITAVSSMAEIVVAGWDPAITRSTSPMTITAAQPPGRRAAWPIQAPSVWMRAWWCMEGAIVSCLLPQLLSEELKKVFALLRAC
jgi:hypothetical protein